MCLLARQEKLRGVVTGDDVTMLWHADQMDWFKGKTEKRFECTCQGRTGPRGDDEKEMGILSSIVI